ncbi:agamous-like MADS-box protein AGL62 [Senna tora]|uniref:Agamous-like MADS-box protein AGL62 n=1 Tax=Senna tora TaxID=362788 RepID=A0A834SZV5_9FABA|nr:agamous-like MADS-box protein AGL62 [Senna tora]
MASPIVAEEKKKKGQQKIKIQRIENEASLGVTFCKRRKGLFSKAAALATLCGAEVAILMASPNGRLYGFGSPSVQAVVERYVSGGPAQPQMSFDALGSLHAELRRVVAEVEVEKERAEELRRSRGELEARCWMATPYDRLTPTQLTQVKARLQDMSMELTRLLDRRVPVAHNLYDNAFPTVDYNFAPNQFCPDGASSSYPPVVLPPAQGIPLPPPPPPMPMMPPMPPVMNENVGFGGGNMVAPPPPYDGYRYSNLGGYGGSSPGPSADAVVERYLHGFHHAPPLQTFAASTSRARSDAVAGGLHAQLQRVEEESRAEKRKASELRRRRKDLEEKCWMAAPIHTMCRPQLMDMKARLLHMSEELTRQISIMGVHNASDNADDAGSSSGAAQLAADQMISPPQMTAPPELDENMAWETNMMMMMSLGDDGCDNLGGPYGRGDGVN